MPTATVLTLCSLLFTAPPAAAAPTPPWLPQLEQATAEAAPSPESEAALLAAIEAAEGHGVEISRSVELRESLASARLALAWVYLNQNQLQAAEQAMDEAIRSSMGRAIPVAAFGPPLLALHERRVAVLRDAETATIRTACQHCQLVIDEHRSPNPSDPLSLGSYRVWLIADDMRAAPAQFDVELEAGEDALIPTPSKMRAPSATKAPASPSPAPAPGLGLGPVGLSSVAMITGGAGLAIGGGLLVSLPGPLYGGRTPQSVGVGLVSAGLSSLGLGLIGLSLDATILKRKREGPGRVALRLMTTGRF